MNYVDGIAVFPDRAQGFVFQDSSQCGGLWRLSVRMSSAEKTIASPATPTLVTKAPSTAAAGIRSGAASGMKWPCPRATPSSRLPTARATHPAHWRSRVRSAGCFHAKATHDPASRPSTRQGVRKNAATLPVPLPTNTTRRRNEIVAAARHTRINEVRLNIATTMGQIK